MHVCVCVYSIYVLGYTRVCMNRKVSFIILSGVQELVFFAQILAMSVVGSGVQAYRHYKAQD